MSGQRYVPSDRYGRERSPPRQHDRYQPGGYAARSDYGSSSGSSRRDVPRGPKALAEPAKSYPSSPFSSRGRNYAPRADSRGDYRESQRESRRSPSRDPDRDRSWRDRDQERRSPSRGRPTFESARDGQEISPRDADPPRGRRDSADVADSSNSHEGRNSRNFQANRGARARGRDAWDRDWRRDSFQSDREQFRGRTRSPRDRSREPDRGRDDRDAERRDEHVDDRDARDRESDRAKREQHPAPHDSRRPSATSTTSTTPKPSAVGATAGVVGARQSNEERDYFTQRRMSNVAAPTTPRDARSESARSDLISTRMESSRGRYSSSASSPPPAPQVPAFGAWNVWRAPTDSKSTQQTVASSVTGPSATAPKGAAMATMVGTERQPPKAPKAERENEYQSLVEEQRAPLPSMVKSEKAIDNGTLPPPKSPEITSIGSRGRTQEPTARSEAPFLKSPPTQPKQLTMMGPRTKPTNPPVAPRSSQLKPISSPPLSPGIAVPSGPRGSTTSFKPPSSMGLNVPTGPKADRASTQPPLQAPTGPGGASGSTWQWHRQSLPSSQASRASSILPLKRDMNGETKGQMATYNQSFGTANRADRSFPADVSTSKAAVDAGAISTGFSNSTSVEAERTVRRSSEKTAQRQGETESSQRTANIGSNKRVAEEDAMDLDETDFGDNEAKFQREKRLLESRKIDLSSPGLCGSWPLENLAWLERITVRDLPIRDGGKFEDPRDNGAYTPRDQLLTPKAEDNEHAANANDLTPPRDSPPPVSSPELRALPFLNNGPPTPIEDSDFFKVNNNEQENLRNAIVGKLWKRKDDEHVVEAQLREEYARIYKPWRRHCEKLDDEVQREKEKGEQAAPEVVAPPVVQEVSPSIGTPLAESRRTRGTFTSEYIVEQVMKESVESALKEQQKREREALSAKPDSNREAVIPEILNDEERRRHVFHDINHLRQPEDALVFYSFEPPRDDFTEEEHNTLVQNFKEYPKKWSKLAQALPGRSYKDCINHYYATKWGKEFKPPKDRRGKKGARGRLGIPRTIQGRPKSNALISGLGGLRPDLYDGDEFSGPVFAVTDSGRPRRAAAPTFGDKDTEEPPATTSTPARKGAKPESGAEATADKSSKRSRAQTKDRSQRRPRNQAPSRQSASPEKTAPVENTSLTLNTRSELELNSRELDVVNGLAALHNAQSLPAAPPVSRSFSPALSTEPPASTEGRRTTNNQNQRPITSSYWSVQEVNAFPQYLEHYGTDWQSISNMMGSKSHTMVKNYYTRLIKEGARPDLEDMAAKADEKKKRGEKIGPPPVPSQTIPRRRNDATQSSASRAMAPNEVIDVEDGSTPQRPRPSKPAGPGQAQMSSTLSAVPQRTYYGQIESTGPSATSPVLNPRVQPFGQSIMARQEQRISQPTSELQSNISATQPQTGTLPPESVASTFVREHRLGQPSSGAGQVSWSIQSPNLDQKQTHRSGIESHLPVQRGESMRHQYSQSGGIPPNTHGSISGALPESPNASHQRRPVEPLPPKVNQTSQDGLSKQHPPAHMFSDPGKAPHMSPPQLEPSRLPQHPSQQNSGATSAPKSEPRKTSNLAAILNADPDPPPMNPKPAVLHSQQSPPAQSQQRAPPPPRPLSQPERRDIFGGPGRQPAHASPQYQATSLNTSTAAYPDSSHRDLGLRSTSSEWSPMPAPSLFNSRPSLQGLNSRSNPSPPPGRREYSREAPPGPRMNPSPPPTSRYDFHRDPNATVHSRSQSQGQPGYPNSTLQQQASPAQASRSLQPSIYGHTPVAPPQRHSPQSQSGHGRSSLLNYTHQRQPSDGHSRIEQDYRRREEQRYGEERLFPTEHRQRADPFYPNPPRDQPPPHVLGPTHHDSARMRDHQLVSDSYPSRPVYGPIAADKPREREPLRRSSSYGQNDQHGRPSSTPHTRGS